MYLATFLQILFQEKLCFQFRKFQPRLGCQDSLVSSSAVSFTVTELPVASVAEECTWGKLFEGVLEDGFGAYQIEISKNI